MTQWHIKSYSSVGEYNNQENLLQPSKKAVESKTQIKQLCNITLSMHSYL